MELAWEYQQDVGAIKYSDYPYVSGSPSVDKGTCKENNSVKIDE